MEFQRDGPAHVPAPTYILTFSPFWVKIGQIVEKWQLDLKNQYGGECIFHARIVFCIELVTVPLRLVKVE